MVKTMGKADVDSKREKPEKQETKSEPARPAKAAQATQAPARAAKKGSMSLEVKMCWITLVVSGILGLVFLLDLFTGIPFGKASPALDVLVVLASLILVYLSWDTLRELR